MPILYYWRPENYARDRLFGFGYHLNQNSPAMTTVRTGDSLWAFTRRKRDGLHVLAAELVTRAVTHNPPNYRYGAHRIWGDLQRSRYFDVDLAPNVEPVIRHLSVSARAERLGQAFQGHAAVRPITRRWTRTGHGATFRICRSSTLAVVSYAYMILKPAMVTGSVTVTTSNGCQEVAMTTWGI